MKKNVMMAISLIILMASCQNEPQESTYKEATKTEIVLNENEEEQEREDNTKAKPEIKQTVTKIEKPSKEDSLKEIKDLVKFIEMRGLVEVDEIYQYTLDEYVKEEPDFPTTVMANFTENGLDFNFGSISFYGENDTYYINLKAWVKNSSDREIRVPAGALRLILDPDKILFPEEWEDAPFYILEPTMFGPIDLNYKIEDISDFRKVLTFDIAFTENKEVRELDQLNHMYASFYLDNDDKAELKIFNSITDMEDFVIATNYEGNQRVKAYMDNEHMDLPSKELLTYWDTSVGFGMDMITSVFQYNDLEYAFSGPYWNDENQDSTVFLAAVANHGENKGKLDTSRVKLTDLLSKNEYKIDNSVTPKLIEISDLDNTKLELVFADTDGASLYGYVLELPEITDKNGEMVQDKTYIHIYYQAAYVPIFELIDEKISNELIATDFNK